VKIFNAEFVYIINLLFTSMILFAGGNTYSQKQFTYDSAEVTINEYIAKNHVPGFAASIVIGKEMLWSNAYGKADIERNIPMTVDAIMNIASISKTFTATAIMQLWEKGLIDLDKDISEYLPFKVRNPNFPDIAITIRQILTHTSSIRDGSAYVKSYSCGDPKISLKDWIYNYLTDTGEFYNRNENFCSWKPGSKREYANVPYGLLGYIVERASQMPFNEYCRKNIFIPLEMTKTGWYLNEIDTTNLITPYSCNSQLKLVRQHQLVLKESIGNQYALCYYSFPNYPDGLVRTSVRELSHYLIAMMNDGKYGNVQIIKKSTIQKMLTLQLYGNNEQGLCWDKSDFEELWGHGGGDPGIRTFLFFNPVTKKGIITFQNSDNGDSFEVVKKLYLLTKNTK